MEVIFDSLAEQKKVLAELVSALRSAESLIAAAQAARDGLLALASHLAHEIAESEGGDDPSSLIPRTVATEIGAALRWSDRTVEHRMGEAARLIEDFPATYAAQSQGRISQSHTRIILEAGINISDPEARADYERDILAYAEQESPGRVRGFARRLAERHQEHTIAERHRIARGLRCVSLTPLEDGMASLGAVLPAVIAHGIYDRLSQMAHTLKVVRNQSEDGAAAADGAGITGTAESVRDSRNVDELRADLFAEMLLTATPEAHDAADAPLAAITARVEITVPVLTLIGAEGDTASATAELDGRQPIDPETARVLAAGAPGWDRVLTLPVTGTLLAVDRYRPSKELRRFLRARDERCRFPACTIRAAKCDIDHHHDAALGGRTEEENLAHLCRRHHVTKHQTPWGVRRLPGGLIEWTSPTGRVYIDRPPILNTVVFAPARSETDELAGSPPAPF